MNAGKTVAAGSPLREAIILAGGFGTRLRSVVADVPKPLAPVAGEPFLLRLLRHLASKGMQRVILSVGYLADQIEAAAGDSYAGMDILYSREDAPLGTGGAMRQAMSLLTSERALILNGDTFLDVDAAAMDQLWQDTGHPVIAVRQVPDTGRYGRIGLDGSRIVSFGDKVAGMGLINAGVYLFPADLFAGFDLASPFSVEADFLAHEVHRRDFAGLCCDGYFIDIGVPEDFARAQTELPGRMA